jgi:hypothetical protein
MMPPFPVAHRSNFVVESDAPIGLTVGEAVEHCLVRNTLRHAPTITWNVGSPAHATAS